MARMNPIPRAANGITHAVRLNPDAGGADNTAVPYLSMKYSTTPSSALALIDLVAEVFQHRLAARAANMVAIHQNLIAAAADAHELGSQVLNPLAPVCRESKREIASRTSRKTPSKGGGASKATTQTAPSAQPPLLSQEGSAFSEI